VAEDDCDSAAVTSVALFIRQLVCSTSAEVGDHFLPWQIIDASTGRIHDRTTAGVAPPPVSRSDAEKYLLFRGDQYFHGVAHEIGIRDLQSNCTFQIAIVTVVSCWRRQVCVVHCKARDMLFVKKLAI